MFFSFVISGRGIAANPEPTNTAVSKGASSFVQHPQPSVFLGSGFDPAGRPGMTKMGVARHA
jgi:hypothetical protein